MIESEERRDPVAELLQRAVELDDGERLASRNQFLRRVDGQLNRSTRGRLVRYGAPLALAASIVLMLFLWMRWKPQRSLDYTVQGASRAGDYVHAPQDHAAEITFSDRTRIHALAGARLRIDERPDGNGARVLVERGRLDAEVTHTGSADWRFEAGPFKVRVTGTRFTLDWNADEEQLEIVLHAGSVEVEGYVGSGVVSVHAGQRFFGDARRRMMLVSDLGAAAKSNAASTPASPSSSTLASARPTPAVVAAPAPAIDSSTPGGTVSWAELVSKGAFREVVAQASSRGTSACLASCTAADLSALADAARYVGQNELAERSLLALRSRPGSKYRVRAAFLLGRIHEGRGDLPAAKSWYETALKEGPNGAFAPEALAGKMRTTNGTEGRVAAQAVARQYLRLYPDGAQAKAARQLAESP